MAKRIFLINALFDELKLAEPMSICSLSSYLKRQGYIVTLIDPSIENLTVENIVEKIVSEQPDICGISIHRDTNKLDALKIIKLLRKKDFNGFVCGGGHGPSIGILHEGKYDTLYTTPSYTELGKYFDLFVMGEGEITLSEIAELPNYTFESWKSIKGIAYLMNGKFKITQSRTKIKNLDELPFIDRSMLEILINKYPIKPTASITAGRGCPYNCSFCSVRAFECCQAEPNYRLRSIDSIIKEIKQINAEYNVSHFDFEDDSICIKSRNSKSRLMDFCEKIELSGIDITFSMYMRMDVIDDDLLKALTSAGLNNIFVGIENFSQKILDFLEKDLTTQTILEKNELLQSHGFSHKVGAEKRIMIGYMNFVPVADYNTLYDSYRYAKQFEITPKILMRNLRMYTGTAIATKIVKLGFYDPDQPQGWKYLDPRMSVLKKIVNNYFNFIIKIRDQLRTIEKFERRQDNGIKEFSNLNKFREELDNCCFNFYLNAINLLLDDGDFPKKVGDLFNHYKADFQVSDLYLHTNEIVKKYYTEYGIESTDLFRR